MDVIDEILDGLRLRSTVFSRMTLKGGWGIQKDQLDGAPFHLIIEGRAWIRAESDEEARPLAAGDAVVLPRGSPHLLLSDPGAVAVPWTRALRHLGWTPWRPGTRFKTVDLHYGEGETGARVISGAFAFGDRRRNPLIETLPALLRVSAAEDSSGSRAIGTIARLLEAEIVSGESGAESVATRLADILFVQMVRHHLLSNTTPPRGWLRGIADRDLAPALVLMHREPDKPWSVATLARELGMSRSRFAARFSDVVGQAPLDYLTQWRMYQAAGRLAEGKAALSAIAAGVGYRSDAAFSKAFRRWAGQSPTAYRRSLRMAAPAVPPERVEVPVLDPQRLDDRR